MTRNRNRFPKGLASFQPLNPVPAFNHTCFRGGGISLLSFSVGRSLVALPRIINKFPFIAVCYSMSAPDKSRPNIVYPWMIERIS